MCRAAAWTTCVGLTLSCLPLTICSAFLQDPEASSSVPADLPDSDGASPYVITSPHPQLPARDTSPILLPLLFLSPSSFFCPTQLCGDPSCPFRCPRSSTSVQQVHHENYSICRYILDAFVGRDKLHVFLLLCHLGKFWGHY